MAILSQGSLSTKIIDKISNYWTTNIFFLRFAYLVSVTAEEWIFCHRVLHCDDDLP
jgi:hypothetical protein